MSQEPADHAALPAADQTSAAIKALLAEQVKAESILNVIGDGISIQDRQYKVLYQNKALLDMVGDCRGRFCYQAYQHRDSLCPGCSVERVFREGIVCRSENRSVHGAKEVHVEITSSPLRDPEGRVVAALEIVRDVTDRKLIEREREELIVRLRDTVEQLSRSKKEWQDTFDSITDMVSIHDRDFTIVKANKAFAGRLGMTPPDVIGNKCHEVMHAGCSPHEKCPHVRTMSGAGHVQEDVCDPGTGETFSVSTFPFHAASGELTGSVHIARNITGQKEQDKVLSMSERFAALGRMAAGVAHEINNPLSAISGCAEGLADRVDRGGYDQELFKQYLAIIKEEIFRCKSITTSMLAVTREESYERKPLEAESIVRRAVELTGFQGRLMSVDIVLDIPPGLPLVRGSEGELLQVLLTLLANALDAMEDRGVLSIKVSGTGDSVELRVTDTGPGIAPEHRHQIFDPFFTTKRGTGNTGLGLSVAKRIMTNHGGSITIDNNSGPGATFIVSVPAVNIP